MIKAWTILKKIEQLSKVNEDEIEEISAYIADDVRNKLYTLDQVRDIITIFSNLDLTSMRYKTREQILYTISEIVYTYQIKELCDLEKILKLRDYLEDDLKQYVDEMINLYDGLD